MTHISKSLETHAKTRHPLDNVQMSRHDRDCAKAYMAGAEQFVDFVWVAARGLKALFAGVAGHPGKPLANH